MTKSIKGRRRSAFVTTVTALGVAVALFCSTAVAAADRDPHIPNADAGWCPGGVYREPLSGGGKYCLGIPFPSGAFYAQSWAGNVSPFMPGHWQGIAMCSAMIEGTVQGGIPYGGIPDCGGGPREVFL